MVTIYTPVKEHNVEFEVKGKISSSIEGEVLYPNNTRRKIYARNVLLHEGLDKLWNTNLTTLTTDAALVRKPYTPASAALGRDDLCRLIEGGPICSPEGGVERIWQESWLEAIMTSIGGSQVAAPDWSYRDYVNTMVFNDSHFAPTSLSGNGPADDPSSSLETGELVNGGNRQLTGFTLARDIVYFPSALTNTGWLTCGGGAHVASFHEMHDPLMYAQFKDENGDPFILDLPEGGQLTLTYVFRQHVPFDIMESSLNGIDISTRAYRVSQTVWLASNGLINIDGTYGANARAWESSSMPSLTASKTGNSVQRTDSIKTKAPYGYGCDIEYIWRPGDAVWTGGVGAITHGSHGSFNDQLFVSTFSPHIPKLNVHRLHFGVRYLLEPIVEA